jgi:hypothetical protein
MSQIGTFETYRAADVGSWGKIGSDRRAVKVALLIHLGALADDRQKSDSSGLVGGPLLFDFLFCISVSRQKLDADLIAGNSISNRTDSPYIEKRRPRRWFADDNAASRIRRNANMTRARRESH